MLQLLPLFPGAHVLSFAGAAPASSLPRLGPRSPRPQLSCQELSGQGAAARSSLGTVGPSPCDRAASVSTLHMATPQSCWKIVSIPSPTTSLLQTHPNPQSGGPGGASRQLCPEAHLGALVMNGWCLPRLGGHHGDERGLHTATSVGVGGVWWGRVVEWQAGTTRRHHWSRRQRGCEQRLPTEAGGGFGNGQSCALQDSPYALPMALIVNLWPSLLSLLVL